MWTWLLQPDSPSPKASATGTRKPAPNKDLLGLQDELIMVYLEAQGT